MNRGVGEFLSLLIIKVKMELIKRFRVLKSYCNWLDESFSFEKYILKKLKKLFSFPILHVIKVQFSFNSDSISLISSVDKIVLARFFED